MNKRVIKDIPSAMPAILSLPMALLENDNFIPYVCFIVEILVACRANVTLLLKKEKRFL